MVGCGAFDQQGKDVLSNYAQPDSPSGSPAVKPQGLGIFLNSVCNPYAAGDPSWSVVRMLLMARSDINHEESDSAQEDSWLRHYFLAV